MKSNKCETSTGVNIAFATILACLVILLVTVLALFTRGVIHSATLPDENQAQCESLGGRWSVNHQCYNAGEPTTIKKLKESLKDVKHHE